MTSYWWFLLIFYPAAPSFASMVRDDYREKCKKSGVPESSSRARAYYVLVRLFCPVYFAYLCWRMAREISWSDFTHGTLRTISIFFLILLIFTLLLFLLVPGTWSRFTAGLFSWLRVQLRRQIQL